MRFESTRSEQNKVGFEEALLKCMPEDGGLYVPYENEDLRNWILYADENTSFANLAGTLTSAIINKEFSPIICETIATKAFPFEPVIKQVDDHLFSMELYHGPTGSFRDFGISYLASAMETILRINGETSILLDASSGPLGSCIASALRGKKLLKSVLIFPKGKICGMDESDFVWNGGNIYPIEVDGTEADCHNLVRGIFAAKDLVKKYHLTVANSANIGRLLPQSFFYTFAFTRIKKHAPGDIFYTMEAGNYGNLVSGLYSWRLALPVKGFILPSTANLCTDANGKVTISDSTVAFEKRAPADPSDPSNLERLEHIFKNYSLMLRSFVYPAKVDREQTEKACKELYMKYHVYADEDTSAAYAASLLRKDIKDDDDDSVVLMMRNAPSLSAEFIKHCIGEELKVPEEIQKAYKPIRLDKPVISPSDIDYVTSVLNSLNLLRIFY